MSDINSDEAALDELDSDNRKRIEALQAQGVTFGPGLDAMKLQTGIEHLLAQIGPDAVLAYNLDYAGRVSVLLDEVEKKAARARLGVK